MTEPAAKVSALFRLKGEHSQPKVPLRIEGNEVKFLKDALRHGCSFWRIEGVAADVLQLEFFVDTRFACSFLVISKSLYSLEEPDQIVNGLFAELTQVFDIAPTAGRLIDSGRMMLQQNSLDADSVVVASQFLRGTNSLQIHEFEERSSRKLAVDPRGIALFGRARNVETIFDRYAVLLALVRAYQYAIDSAVDHLAQLVEQPESALNSAALSALQRDSLVFAARFLFARPVRLDTVDLRYVWERLAQVHHLRESHEELTEQLSAVHALLMHDEETRETTREKRSQLWLALIGLMLALISLLGLVDVTPDKLAEFWQAWFG